MSYFPDVLCEYICSVLCDVLHCQMDPLSICLIFRHYDDEILFTQNTTFVPSSLTAFYNYYSKWISEKSQKLKVKYISK